LSANERTGWRDEWLSNRHRKWGNDCPAVDIDFLMIEYNHKWPVALIDYKYWTGKYLDTKNNASITAMINLANLAKIPAALSYYSKHPTNDICRGFKVQGLNEFSGKAFNTIIRMSEYDYVKWLYAKRGTKMPDGVAKILCRDTPPESEKDLVQMDALR